MKECVNHLVEDHGYRKIAFVAGPKRNYDSNRRLQAYKDVLTEHGIAINEEMIVHGSYTEYVDAEVEYLLDHFPDLEAIVFANDNMAKGGYRAVQAALELCKGTQPKSEEMKAYFYKRESCGCNFVLNETKKIVSYEELKGYIAERVDAITEELFFTIPYEKDKNQYKIWIVSSRSRAKRLFFCFDKWYAARYFASMSMWHCLFQREKMMDSR